MALLREQFSNVFELPPEVVLDAPLLMLVGKKKMYLENHKGIALYQNDLLKIRINSGFLILKGNSLEINQINSHNIYISGIIKKISYEQS